jgi:hypothetical protein
MAAAACVFSAHVLPAQSAPQSTIRSAHVLPSKDAVEIEVEASDRVVPQTQVLSGPDRLVIDFPNAVPGDDMRSQSVNLGEVKDLRFGLFQSKPPVTRIVLDLKTAQSFQVFPYGRTVVIKISGAAASDAIAAIDPSPERAADPAPATTHPGLVVANYTNRAEPIHRDPPAASPSRPTLDVTFRNGMLAIRSNKATLSEVLYAVQQRTGAEISIASGAEQEKVVADLGPAPAAEVLAHLLNGSKFNFLIVNASKDPRQVEKVILTPRVDGMPMPLPPLPQEDQAQEEEPAPAPAPPPVRAVQRRTPMQQMEPQQQPPDTNVGDPQPDQ